MKVIGSGRSGITGSEANGWCVWRGLHSYHRTSVRSRFLFPSVRVVQGCLFPHSGGVFLTSPAKAVLLIPHCLNILAQVGDPEAKPLTLPLGFAGPQKALANAGWLKRFGPECFHSPGGACFSHSSSPWAQVQRYAQTASGPKQGGPR